MIFFNNLKFCKKNVIILLFLFIYLPLRAQTGCTDSQAQNFNPYAKTNDGSCTYPATALPLTDSRDLPASINENSGLILTDGQLWTINDSGGDANLYRISETDGTILQIVTVTGATNVDWEAITADSMYLYIGDFGNNANGNRTDLKVYRVKKIDILPNTTFVSSEIINFNYADQLISGPTGNNNTIYDCEAFFVKDNTLHLFTKEWISPYNTRHYTVPAIPSEMVYNAVALEIFGVKGLITDAVITSANTVVLIGYGSNLLDLFMWQLYDFKTDSFFSGNKRRFSLGNSTNKGQIEGVALTPEGNGYISSERVNRTVFGFTIVVPPKLHKFSLVNYMARAVNAPLPVELINFGIYYLAPNVTLKWATAQEVNSESFIVERAADAVNFKPIGIKPAAGNSNALNNYRFLDPFPADDENYYRLKMVDLDGTFSYSAIKQVRIKKVEADLKVSPVPAKPGDILSIALSLVSSNGYIISLTGTDGKIYYQKRVLGLAGLQEQVAVDNLSRGIYILRVNTASNTFTTKVSLL